MIFHRQVWYLMFSLRCTCIRSLGIILIPYATFVPNFVSFATSIELAHGEKLHTQSPSLFDARGTETCASEKYNIINWYKFLTIFFGYRINLANFYPHMYHGPTF